MSPRLVIKGTEPVKATASGQLRICCPFCDDEKYHCYISKNKKAFHCFKCEASGSVGTKGSSSLDLSGWRNALAGILGSHKPIPECRTLLRTLPRCESLAIQCDNAEYEYVRSRGITHEEIVANDLCRGIDREGLFSECVVFPQYANNYFDVEYFVCRKLFGEPKYANAPWSKCDTLYQPHCAVSSSEFVGFTAIVEGPIDAIKTARVLLTVALLGKKPNAEQVERLKNTRTEYLIMLDADAESHAMRLQAQLGRGKIVKLPKGRDPGSMTADEIKGCIHA